MTKTKTFALNTNQFSPTGQYLLTYAQKHPEEFGVGSIVTTAGVANFVVPLVLGFTPAGPVAGNGPLPHACLVPANNCDRCRCGVAGFDRESSRGGAFRYVGDDDIERDAEVCRG